MDVVIMKLHNSWKWVVLHTCNWIAMSYMIYTMSYNYATHSTCPLRFMVYKYSGLQVFSATQKLSLYIW
jgi:hypothetical protein